MRTPRLAALELRKFGRGRLPRAAMAALLLLPLLYGALYLWSFWDPYGRLDKVPVALVNADRGATVDGKRIDAGADLVRGLNGNSESFDWRTTDAAHAAKGVENGTYYLSLTIPADFSRRIASSSGNDPQTGALQVRTNDANNYIVGQISRTVFSEIRAAASAKASRGFYDKIFVSFADLHDKTQQAADGAGKLDNGLGQAKQGGDKLAGGLGTAKKGGDKLAAGLGTAKQGSDALAGGAGALNSGLGKLESGSSTLAGGARTAADGTQQLADKVNAVAGQVEPFVKDHYREIGAAAQLVADASKTIEDNLGQLPKAVDQADSQAKSAYGELRTSYTTRCEGAATPDPTCPALKQEVAAAKVVASVASQLDTLVHDNSGTLSDLGTQLGQLHTLAQQLADEAPHLPDDIRTAVSKVNELNSGVHALAQGADSLHTGLTSAKQGAGRLDSGAGQLDSGLGTLKEGGDTLAGGLGTLRNGAQTLDGGLYKLADGSDQLATGLRDGVGQIPDYDTQQRDARTSVMADPVQLAAKATHKAGNYGTGFAPYFIPLSLWVGAMVAYMLMQPLNRRALAAGAPAWRIAFAGWLPVAAVGVLQVAALLSVLHWAIGLDMVRTAGTVAFLLLVTSCFAAIVQWLNARFGPAGRVLVLALLMLQLTSAGGTYPVQTSPGFFNAIHPFLPMSYIVDGLRHLITGGEMWPVWRACLVLLAFTAGSLVLTAWTARRKQVWTVDRLHPEISL
ncbi:YhgE/Pip domain-containing protein [Streptomyces sp. ICBB 8177]|uniref:YhgE/Pip family protein n=1 Tax=Streptomyces sp. ICBB 8177 TaxID=563922 RepID=UPI000D67EC98|nr:YhgE/Pip domain-containing protein [Streptomyces sp. ICBB 8177]PWI43409.1 hypothetical protein CK485_14800 [Streptomyces sp. ICBB 8177]